MTQERFFAFSAHEMLDVPVLAQSSDDSLFNWPTTSAANRDSHSIVASQAVQLVHVVSSKPGAAFDLASCRVQLDAAARAVEVIAVIDFASEAQRRAVDESVALLARIFPDLGCLDARIASVAQSSIVVANEPGVRQLFRTQLTTETFRMPTGLHGFDDTPDDDVPAFVAKRSVENSEILLAVLAAFEFVENPVLEGAEALSATKK